VPGPYTRVAHGDRANDGSATDAAALVNAHSAGLEALEALVGNAYRLVTNEGVAMDGRQVNLVITSGSTTATAVTAGSYFDSSHVGKTIWIDTATTVHKTTIAAVVSATQITLSVAPSQSGSNVSAVYGTDNTTTFGTFLSSLNIGDVAIIPASDRFIITEGGYSLSMPGVVIEGLHSWYSQIVVPHLTNNLFTLSGWQPRIRNVHLMHAAFCGALSGLGSGSLTFPTAGAAIRQDDSGTNAHIDAHYTDVTTSGFYNNIKVVSGWGAKMERVWNLAAVNSGIVLESQDADLGDFHLMDCRHYSDPSFYAGAWGAQVLWLNGGLFRVAGNSFTNGNDSIELRMTASGGKPYSTNLRITDNSFEDPGGSCVLINSSASTSFQSLVIANNAMNSVRGGKQVYATLPGSATVSNFTIQGNSSNTGYANLVTTATGSLVNGVGTSSIACGTTNVRTV